MSKLSMELKKGKSCGKGCKCKNCNMKKGKIYTEDSENVSQKKAKY